MTKIAFINSRYKNFNDATIHIEDRGFQFADSVYEVISFFNENLIDLKLHFLRLRYSLNELDIQYNFTDEKLTKIFWKLIRFNSLKSGIIYLQITRGVQPRSHAYKHKIKPTVVIYTQKKTFNIPGNKFTGVNVITHEDLRWSRKDIKTVNLLPNILIENLAHKKNAYTAILIKNNKITEGNHSNIWIVKNNNIFTHPINIDILKGVTRTTLISIIKKCGFKLIEKNFTKKQLYNSDEIFLTSSTGLITPILKVDSKLINKGKIGNITIQLAILYFKLILK